MHGCMLVVDGGEHARATPSDSAGVLAGAVRNVGAAVAPLLPSRAEALLPSVCTVAWVVVAVGLLALELGLLELSWLADVLGLRDATQPALLAGTPGTASARRRSRTGTSRPA